MILAITVAIGLLQTLLVSIFLSSGTSYIRRRTIDVVTIAQIALQMIIVPLLEAAILLTIPRSRHRGVLCWAVLFLAVSILLQLLANAGPLLFDATVTFTEGATRALGMIHEAIPALFPPLAAALSVNRSHLRTPSLSPRGMWRLVSVASLFFAAEPIITFFLTLAAGGLLEINTWEVAPYAIFTYAPPAFAMALVATVVAISAGVPGMMGVFRFLCFLLVAGTVAYGVIVILRFSMMFSAPSMLVAASFAVPTLVNVICFALYLRMVPALPDPHAASS